MWSMSEHDACVFVWSHGMRVCVFRELTLKQSRFLKVKGVISVNEPFLADCQHGNRQKSADQLLNISS